MRRNNSHWTWTLVTLLMVSAMCWIDIDTLSKTGEHSHDILFPLLAFCSFVMAVATWVTFLQSKQ